MTSRVSRAARVLEDAEVGVDTASVVAALRRRWPVVVVLTLLGLGLGLAHATLTPARYEASATVFFSLQRGQSVNELVQGSTYTQDLVQSYASVATMPVVLDPVIAELGLDTTAQDLARDVSARAPLGTVLLEITAERPDPDDAARVADAVARQLDPAAARLSSGAEGSGAITVTVTKPASPPASPSWPRRWLDLAVGLLVGLAAGVAAAVVLALASDRVDGRAALARVSEVPLVGSVPGEPGRRRRGRQPAATSAPGARAEAYRTLRTNLEFLRVGAGGAAVPGDAGACQVVVVSSALAGEGKTTTAVNLAAALAETGQRAVLVDADLRRPGVAPALGLEGGVGLTTVLAGRARLDDVVQVWGASGLRVLAAGEVPPNPSEMLASPMMARVLAALRADHDVVVLDAAPTLPVTDAALLGARTDGVLLVVDARRGRARRLAETLERLRTAGSPVLGVVLNRTSRSREEGYYGQRARRGAVPERPEREGEDFLPVASGDAAAATPSPLAAAASAPAEAPENAPAEAGPSGADAGTYPRPGVSGRRPSW